MPIQPRSLFSAVQSAFDLSDASALPSNLWGTMTSIDSPAEKVWPLIVLWKPERKARERPISVTMMVSYLRTRDSDSSDTGAMLGKVWRMSKQRRDQEDNKEKET